MSIKSKVLFGAIRIAMRRGGAPTVEALRRLQGPPLMDGKEVRGVAFRDDFLGTITVEVSEPEGELQGDLLFLHGGAYIAGTRRSVRPIIGAVCREAGWRGWSPEYRLGPEHPFPAGLDDAVAAWVALLERGVDLSRTMLGGESAGGGLALATAIALRDRGLPMPAGLVLLWPWTDLTLSGASVRSNARKDYLPRALMEIGVQAYCTDPTDPLVSPLNADLAGLPPVFLQVGGHDMVRDDSTRLALRLEAADVAHVLHVWRGMPHAWVGAGDGIKEARKAAVQTAAWMRAQIQRSNA